MCVLGGLWGLGIEYYLGVHNGFRCGIDAASFANFSTIRSNFDKVGSTLVSQISPELGLSEDEVSELTKIVMAADTTTTFESIVEATGMFNHFVNLAKQTTHLTEGSSADPYAAFGMMTQIAKDPTKVYVDSEYLDLVNVASDDQITQCTTNECKDALGRNMFKTIELQGFNIVSTDAGIATILKDMRTTIGKGETITIGRYTPGFVSSGGQAAFPFGGTYTASATCRGLIANLQLMFASTNGTAYTHCANCPSSNTLNISGGECSNLTSGPLSNPQTCSCTRASGTGSSGTSFNISCSAAGPLQACSTTLTKQ